MTKLPENRIVVVTGGSRGIGRAIALVCARHGADVVVNYRTNPLLPAQAHREIDALVAISSIGALVGDRFGSANSCSPSSRRPVVRTIPRSDCAKVSSLLSPAF
jgi:NAD(P)-dependent dehydrogenase (short-subunit alcohol dehydrogenase family)